MKILFIIPDFDHHVPYFPLGPAYLASVLRKAGHEVCIYSQDIEHYSEKHLYYTLQKNHFDVLALGSVAGYYPYKKVLKISDVINSLDHKPLYVIGGHMFSVAPDYFLKKLKADICIIGEGEITFVELLNNLSNLDSVNGIAYRNGDNDIIVNKARPVYEHIDDFPLPAYDLFPIGAYRLQKFPNIGHSEFGMSIITGRGCNFSCKFCAKLYDGVRLRNIQSIIDEIFYLKVHYGITYFDFADDLTMASKQRAVELCEAIIKNNLKIHWRCEGRLNYVDKEVVILMKKAGCVFINYGIEALDDKVLAAMKKCLTVQQIISGVETTLEAGVSPGLNIIWNNLYDNLDTLKKGVNFLLKYDDGAQIRTIRFMTPYPGTEAFKEAIELGKIKDVADFYEIKHKNSDLLTVNFMDLSDEEAYNALYSANFQLLTNYYKKKIYSVETELKELYINKNENFRGYRHV